MSTVGVFSVPEETDLQDTFAAHPALVVEAEPAAAQRTLTQQRLAGGRPQQQNSRTVKRQSNEMRAIAPQCHTFTRTAVDHCCIDRPQSGGRSSKQLQQTVSVAQHSDQPQDSQCLQPS